MKRGKDPHRLQVCFRAVISVTLILHFLFPKVLGEMLKRIMKSLPLSASVLVVSWTSINCLSALNVACEEVGT